MKSNFDNLGSNEDSFFPSVYIVTLSLNNSILLNNPLGFSLWSDIIESLKSKSSYRLIRLPNSIVFWHPKNIDTFIVYNSLRIIDCKSYIILLKFGSFIVNKFKF